MPGYTLRFHSFSSLLSTTTTHPESSPLHSSPATRDSIDSSPNMASSKVITCHSTDRASFHSEIQGPQLTPADRLDDDEASTSGTRSQELQMVRAFLGNITHPCQLTIYPAFFYSGCPRQRPYSL